MTSPELRDKVKNIVTRKGKTVRIPEILEAELDDLVALIDSERTAAELDAYRYAAVPGHFYWNKDGTRMTVEERIKQLKEKKDGR